MSTATTTGTTTIITTSLSSVGTPTPIRTSQ